MGGSGGRIRCRGERSGEGEGEEADHIFRSAPRHRFLSLFAGFDRGRAG